MNSQAIPATPSIPQPPAGPITDSVEELSQLMERHQMPGYVLYTLTPAGSILSYTGEAALREALGLITAKLHRLQTQSLQTAPSHE